jgi:hypothetical protein
MIVWNSLKIFPNRFFSNERDVFIKLSSDRLNTFYSESRERLEDSTVLRFNEALTNSKIVEEGEFLITVMEVF